VELDRLKRSSCREAAVEGGDCASELLSQFWAAAMISKSSTGRAGIAVASFMAGGSETLSVSREADVLKEKQWALLPSDFALALSFEVYT